MKSKATILALSTLALVGAGLGVLLWNSRPTPIATEPRQAPAIEKINSISPAVLTLLSEQALSLNERLDALRLVRHDLPAADRQALLRALSAEKPPGLSDDDWFTLANDIMQTLRHQQPALAEITPALLALWHNHQLDATLRDYSLQHLREWVYDHDTRSSHETAPQRIAEIQQTFLHLLDPTDPDYDPASTTLGTALLALHEWHNPAHLHQMKDSSFEPRLVTILSDPAVHRGTRATALQIAGQRKLATALPAARAILQEASADMILRLAAINFLGTNGGTNDKEFLLNFQQQHSNDTLLQSSLAKALQSLTTP